MFLNLVWSKKKVYYKNEKSSFRKWLVLIDELGIELWVQAEKKKLWFDK